MQKPTSVLFERIDAETFDFETISASDLRKSIADRLNEAGFQQRRFLVERHGKPVAALVTLRDARILEALYRKAYADLAQESHAASSEFLTIEQAGLSQEPASSTG